MNAVATAKNRPTYRYNKRALINTSCGTHEDQECVQVSFEILQEIFVIFCGYLVVVLVEFSLTVALGGQFALLWAV
jgi:hypothetical protein